MRKRGSGKCGNAKTWKCESAKACLSSMEARKRRNMPSAPTPISHPPPERRSDKRNVKRESVNTKAPSRRKRQAYHTPKCSRWDTRCLIEPCCDPSAAPLGESHAGPRLNSLREFELWGARITCTGCRHEFGPIRVTSRCQYHKGHDLKL